MSVEAMPAAQSSDRPSSCLDPAKRTTEIAHVLRVHAKPSTMNTWASFVRWMVMGCTLAIGFVLSGCEPPPPRLPGPMIVGITGYNFTHEGVQEYYVDGNRGSNLPPYGGGGSTSCCVQLPGQWAPELTVKVSWTIGDWKVPYEQIANLSTKEQIACCWAERTLSKIVPVERYGKEGGGVQVFFLPDDEIKVWVSDLGLGHERHPSGMPYPRKPVEAE